MNSTLLSQAGKGLLGILVLIGTAACAPEPVGPTASIEALASTDRVTDRGESDAWIQVSGGGAVACGLKKSGRLFCWGQNGGSSPGGLGNGTTGGLSTVPVEVNGARMWSTVSTGYDGSCAVTNDGRGYCWRGNHFGSLGIGANPADVPYSAVPVEIAGGHKWSM